MNVVLLDTSVASLLHPSKKDDNALRAKYEPNMRGRILALSFQTVAELWNWAENKRWGDKQREKLDAFIQRFLVIPYDYQLAKTWAKVMSASRGQGRRLESGDCWIVATAVHRGVPLLTHDRHMIGLQIEGLRVITHVEIESP